MHSGTSCWFQGHLSRLVQILIGILLLLCTVALGPKTRWVPKYILVASGAVASAGCQLTGSDSVEASPPAQRHNSHCRRRSITAVILSRVLTAIQALWLCHSVTHCHTVVTPNPPHSETSHWLHCQMPPCFAESHQLRGRE